MTIEEAADILNVSTSYVEAKIVAGEILTPIDRDTLLAYKAKLNAEANLAFDEMVAMNQKWGMHDIEDES